MSPPRATDGKLDISVIVDPDSLKGRPAEVTSAWIGYAMARANWISDYIKANPSEAKSYTRSFGEEVAGRDGLCAIWVELKAGQPELRDSYLDQLQKVKEGGFLREYVWINLRLAAWTEPPDLNVERYREWAASNLVGHTVETHGDARIQDAAGK
jgi:hypothetical protein